MQRREERDTAVLLLGRSESCVVAVPELGSGGCRPAAFARVKGRRVWAIHDDDDNEEEGKEQELVGFIRGLGFGDVSQERREVRVVMVLDGMREAALERWKRVLKDALGEGEVEITVVLVLGRRVAEATTAQAERDRFMMNLRKICLHSLGGCPIIALCGERNLARFRERVFGEENVVVDGDVNVAELKELFIPEGWDSDSSIDILADSAAKAKYEVTSASSSISISVKDKKDFLGDLLAKQKLFPTTPASFASRGAILSEASFFPEDTTSTHPAPEVTKSQDDPTTFFLNLLQNNNHLPNSNNSKKPSRGTTTNKT